MGVRRSAVQDPWSILWQIAAVQEKRLSPPDQSPINRLIAGFYAAFDNRQGRVIDVTGLRRMFLPSARVTRVSAGQLESWSVDEFIAPRAALLGDGSLVDFHEWEVEGATTIFDHIAERRSHYRKSGVLRGRPHVGEGRKIISLCHSEGCWRIVAVLWEEQP